MSKTLTGTVVSTKMNNTIVVEVVRRTPHPLYKKLLKKTKRFKVHSEKPTVKVGDVVEFVETRPISKDKHFMLKEGGRAS